MPTREYNSLEWMSKLRIIVERDASFVGNPYWGRNFCAIQCASAIMIHMSCFGPVLLDCGLLPVLMGQSMAATTPQTPLSESHPKHCFLRGQE